MKQYLRLGVIGLISAATLLATAHPAFAQSAQTNPPKGNFQEVCKRIKNRLNIRIGTVTDAKDENTTVYEGINKRLERVITASEKQQYDTTDLKAALTKTRSAVAAYTTANKAYTTELTATANSVCKSENEYKLAIVTTRSALKSARDAGVTARNSFQYDVIPALRAYKVWLNERDDAATKEPAVEPTETTEGTH